MEILNEAPVLIGSVQTWLQFCVFIILLIVACVVLWIKEGHGAMKRSALRDSQHASTQTELEKLRNTIQSIEKQHSHLNGRIESLDGRLRFIEENLIKRDEWLKLADTIHKIDKSIAIIQSGGKL